MTSDMTHTFWCVPAQLDNLRIINGSVLIDSEFVHANTCHLSTDLVRGLYSEQQFIHATIVDKFPPPEDPQLEAPAAPGAQGRPA